MGDPSRVELLVLDVDGIFTDGGIYVTSDGTDFKRFYVRDGMGVRLFREVGLRIGIVSKVIKQDYGLFQDIEVTPSVDFSKLEEVLIIIRNPDETDL